MHIVFFSMSLKTSGLYKAPAIKPPVFNGLMFPKLRPANVKGLFKLSGTASRTSLLFTVTGREK